jgi:hypothetical protein
MAGRVILRGVLADGFVDLAQDIGLFLERFIEVKTQTRGEAQGQVLGDFGLDVAAGGQNAFEDGGGGARSAQDAEKDAGIAEVGGDLDARDADEAVDAGIGDIAQEDHGDGALDLGGDLELSDGVWHGAFHEQVVADEGSAARGRSASRDDLDLEVEEFGVAFTFGMLHEPGQGAFQLPGVGADHGDAEQGMLGVFQVIDFGDGDIVVVMPAVFEGAEDFPLVLEVESIADSQFQLQDSDQHSGQWSVTSGQKGKIGLSGRPLTTGR